MKRLLSVIAYSGLLLLAVVCGCVPPVPPEVVEPIDPAATIGDVARIYYYDDIPVRGIGIVAGLHGTGSSECPPAVRENLEKFIWKQIPVTNAINARAFIESTNTAVVEVFGVIPALSSDRDTFDVAVRPLSSSQTTSLDGGHLYATELKELSRLANLEQFTMFSKTLATVEGPIFSNELSSSDGNKDLWYVLGGGRSVQSTVIRVLLNRPDFLTANAIRNRINERFKAATAVPVSEREINLHVPVNYLDRKERFLEMVRSLQLGDNPALKQYHINELIQRLLGEPDNETFEKLPLKRSASRRWIP